MAVGEGGSARLAYGKRRFSWRGTRPVVPADVKTSEVGADARLLAERPTGVDEGKGAASAAQHEQEEREVGGAGRRGGRRTKEFDFSFFFLFLLFSQNTLQ